ncbi:MAG: hypothetical protein LM555_02300 [Desulfurococcaceae archaeon]|nr:hypothetical protein [Desulfurococcaceae archaeon]
MCAVGFFTWLVNTVYKSIFLTGDTGLRRAHAASKILFTTSLVVAYTVNPEKSPTLLPLLVALGVLHAGFEWVVAALTLVSLVSAYLAGSAYLLSLTGLYTMTPLQALLVVARATAVAFGVVLVFNMISPVELYNALHTLGAKHFSSYPLLVWRLMPLGLRNFTDSVAVGYLKREKITSRIPPATASIIEAGWFIEEYSYWRLRVKSKTQIPLPRSIVHSLVLVAASLTILLLALQ